MSVVKLKRGATFKLVLEFTELEWLDIYPFTSIECDVGQGSARYDTNISIDAASRSVLISASTDSWKLGLAKLDIRVVKSGQVIMIPADSVIQFNVVASVTDGSTYERGNEQ